MTRLYYDLHGYLRSRQELPHYYGLRFGGHYVAGRGVGHGLRRILIIQSIAVQCEELKAQYRLIYLIIFSFATGMLLMVLHLKQGFWWPLLLSMPFHHLCHAKYSLSHQKDFESWLFDKFTKFVRCLCCCFFK